MKGKRREETHGTGKGSAGQGQKVMAAAAIVAFLMLALAFHRALAGSVTAAALIGFALIPAVLKRKLEGQMPIGPEFNTFGTVIMGVAFGPAAGAAFGITLTMIAATVEKAFNIGTPLSLAISAAIGGLASPLGHMIGVTWAGMALLAAAVIISNAFMMLVQKDAQFTAMSIVGSVINIAINYLLLSYAAEPILSLVS